MRIKREQIPWAMAIGRSVLGPVLVLGERAGWNGLTMAWFVVAALLSDIFDGVLARRWGCDTAAVRLFDTIADTVFYLGAGIALSVRRPEIVRDNGALLLGLLGLEAARWAVEFWKFGRPASYHSYLAKCWGLVLATGIVTALALQRNTIALTAGLALGIVSNLEGLAMSLALPVWRRDVKTMAEAWRVRRQLRRAALGPVAVAAATPHFAHKRSSAVLTSLLDSLHGALITAHSSQSCIATQYAPCGPRVRAVTTAQPVTSAR